MGVDADSQNLNFFLLLLGQKTFQLPELLYAVGSPMAPVEDKYHILFTSKIGKRNCLPIHIF